ncbi:SpoIIE family protein phosphatase [Ruminococcus sp.]|uniref:SpoIIE family protein phosphatase n=1 Tax=Ruminococcus sp. TaxID=41978 RepID=UPI0025D12AD2|nr:SpoIIE family protein phosphatase [Ruminococcus sp.]MBQ8965637.1 SpoIIE family protein phosphatase [Ruminococcus sp.]
MKKNKKHLSLAAKTVRSTVRSCVLFGIVFQIVALSFYAVTLTKQYISAADTSVRQAALSVKLGADSQGLAKQVMDTYRSLDDEQRSQVGTVDYRRYYQDIDIDGEGRYTDVLRIVQGAAGCHAHGDVEDIYLAMYDEDTSAMVYMADPEAFPDDTGVLLPGDWESVDHDGMMKFLHPAEDAEVLYDMGYAENYGLLCTVGAPVKSDDGSTYAFVLADISLANIRSGMVGFSIQLTVIMVLMTVLLVFFQTRVIKQKLVRPINLIAEAADDFASDRNSEPPKEGYFANLDIHSGDEIEHLADNMASMERDLYAYGRDLLRITKEKERIGTELELARKIQADMLPNDFPPFPDRHEFDIYASMTPAKEVGGDFNDFFFIDDDHLGLVMADVSGKGVPAALFMMMSKIYLKNFAMQQLSPARVMEMANEVICSRNKEEMFVTVWLGVLELSTGRLTAANAGHEYPAIRRPGGSFELLKDKHGFVLGGMGGLRYSEYELTLEKGSTIFLYTDGVPEATSAAEELFGTDRMLKALDRDPAASPEELLRNVRAAVDSFVGEAEQFDDLTMMSVKLN